MNAASPRLQIGAAMAVVMVCLVLAGLLLMQWSARPWSGVTLDYSWPGQEGPLAIRAVEADSPAAEAGLKKGQRVVSFEGIPARDTATLIQREEQLAVGDSVEFLVLDVDADEDASPQAIYVELASQLDTFAVRARLTAGALCALLFLLVGFFVFVRRPEDRRARVFLWLNTIYGASYLSFDALLQGSSPAGVMTPDQILRLTFAGGLLGLGGAATLLHFALVFPRVRPILRDVPETLGWVYGPFVFVIWPGLYVCTLIGLPWLLGHEAPGGTGRFWRAALEHPWVGALFLGLAFAGLAWSAMAFLKAKKRHSGWVKGLAREPFRVLNALGLIVASVSLASLSVPALVEDAPAWPALLATSGPILLLSLFVVGAATLQPLLAVVCFVLSYVQSGPDEKRQIRWPLWGSITALVGVTVVTIASFGIVAYAPSFPYFGLDLLSKFLAVLIPVSFAFGILRYRLMEIDVVIRRSVVYLVVTGVLVIVYLGVTAGVSAVLVSGAGLQGQWAPIIAVLAVALAFAPIRTQAQSLVERTLFRERHDYPAAEKRYEDAIREVDTPRGLAELLASSIQRELPNRAVVVFLRSATSGALRAESAVGDLDLARDQIPSVSGGEVFDGLPNVPFMVGAGGPELPEELVESARITGAEIIAPLDQAERFNGFVTVGKATVRREPYEEPERAFVGQLVELTERRLAEIELEGQRGEVNRARQIQEKLLPQELPNVPGSQLASRYQPCYDVGGDYFDAIALPEGRLGVAVADVAGKGLSAAMLMSNAQAAFQALAGAGMEVSELMGRLNTVLARNVAEGRFVTFVYGELDPTTGEFRFVNAGNTEPVLVPRSGKARKLGSHGPPLGLFDEWDYESGTLVLDPGDRVLLFTDGISEAENRDGEFFGEKNLLGRLATLGKAHPAAETFAKALVDEVMAHARGEPQDDVTLLIVGRS